MPAQTIGSNTIVPKKKKQVAVPLPVLPSYNAFGTTLNTPGGVQIPAIGGDIYSALGGFTDATNQANQANNLRYNQGLGVLTGGQGQAAGFIEKAIADSDAIGYAARRDVRNQLQQDIGKTEQQAISRGIGNTTIRNSLLDQDRRRANDSMQNINEAAAGRRSALRLQQANQSNLGSGRIADFIANRNDVAPDLGLISSLIRDASAAPDPNAPKNTSRVIGGYTFASDVVKPGVEGGATQMSTSTTGGGGGGGGLSMGGGGGGDSGGGSNGAQYFAPAGGTSTPSAPGIQVSTPSKSAATPAKQCVNYSYIFHSGMDPKSPTFCHNQK